MSNSKHASPIQLRQTKQQFSNSDNESLSRELGAAVQNLPPRFTRFLAGGIGIIFLSALTWASFSNVDEVAETQGQIVPASQVQPMRALSNGRLETISVIEHQYVREGDILVRLDPTFSEAEVQKLKEQVRLKQQDLSRLQAERTGSTDAGNLLQNQLLAVRLRGFRDRIAAAEATAQQQLSMVKTSQLELNRLQSELSLALTKSQSLETLVSVGAFPRLDYLDARGKAVSLQAEVAKQMQAVSQAQQAAQVAQANVRLVESDRQNEILSQIDSLEQALADLQGQLDESQKQQDLGIIKAPISGTVYNIRVSSTEGIVQSGEELLSIVPDGETLRLEVKVSNRDIGFVKSGMPAKVKLLTFPYQEFGTLEGRVEQGGITPNAIPDKDGNLLYTARVQLVNLRQNSISIRGHNVLLTPGMAATAEIVIRPKSIMSFLLDPIIENWDRAFSVR